jgi:RNA polymerase sigma factor (sigma-70 family)
MSHNSRSCEKRGVALTADDDELLVRFAAGDADAFVAFYRRHLPAMLAFFLRRTGDPELTADLTAEVFAAALLAAERYEPGERPALAWLYGIAAHKLSDSRRHGRVEDRARRRLALEPLAIDDTALERVEQLASDNNDDESRIADAIRSLPAAQRDAVLARVVEERPYPEIAAAMSCSELLVRQRVSRALRTLRTQIGDPDE